MTQENNMEDLLETKDITFMLMSGCSTEEVNEAIRLNDSLKAPKFVADEITIDGVKVKNTEKKSRFKIDGEFTVNIHSTGNLCLSLYKSETRVDKFGNPFKIHNLVDHVWFNTKDKAEILKLAVQGYKHYELTEESNGFFTTETTPGNFGNYLRWWD